MTIFLAVSCKNIYGVFLFLVVLHALFTHYCCQKNEDKKCISVLQKNGEKRQQLEKNANNSDH